MKPTKISPANAGRAAFSLDWLMASAERAAAGAAGRRYLTRIRSWSAGSAGSAPFIRGAAAFIDAVRTSDPALAINGQYARREIDAAARRVAAGLLVAFEMHRALGRRARRRGPHPAPASPDFEAQLREAALSCAFWKPGLTQVKVRAADVAAQMHLHRTTLYDQIKRHGISWKDLKREIAQQKTELAPRASESGGAQG